MARALLKYSFAALLALLSAQAIVPSARVRPAGGIVWRIQAEQQAPRETRRVWPEVLAARCASAYISWPRPEPQTAILFQRPPPAHSLFS